MPHEGMGSFPPGGIGRASYCVCTSPGHLLSGRTSGAPQPGSAIAVRCLCVRRFCESRCPHLPCHAGARRRIGYSSVNWLTSAFRWPAIPVMSPAGLYCQASCYARGTRVKGKLLEYLGTEQNMSVKARTFTDMFCSVKARAFLVGNARKGACGYRAVRYCTAAARCELGLWMPPTQASTDQGASAGYR